MSSNKRLRLLAGPNGSGKYTLFAYLKLKFPEVGFSVFVNADELQKQFELQNFIDLSNYNLVFEQNELQNFAMNSNWSQRIILSNFEKKENQLFFKGLKITAYDAAFIADFLREKLLENEKSFSFESVMSHPSKILFLKKAQAQNYRVYLYFIATESSEVNKIRVANRVEQGGHDVSAEKIESRYLNTLGLLKKSDSIYQSSICFRQYWVKINSFCHDNQRKRS